MHGLLETPLAGRSDIRRILVIKWSAMGDVVIATAIMEDLARAFPQAEIVLDTLPACAGLFAHDPRFARVQALDMRARAGRWRQAFDWLRQARAGRYDLIVDLQRSDRVRGLLIALRLIGAAPRHVIGNRGGFPYTVQPAIRDKKAPALPMMRSMLEAAGIAYATTRPVLYASAEHRAHVARLKAEHGLEDGRYTVLLPGSQAAGWLKRWGVANYRALARRLLDAPDGFTRVAVVGGPDEVDDCAAIAADNPGVVNLNGALKLLEIAPLCEGAACVAANDTGTAHIAAAADRPMLVICGPTNPARVKPIGERVRAIQARLPCRDCYAKDCANPERLACMARLTPEFVAAELRDVMHGGGNATAASVDILRV